MFICEADETKPVYIFNRLYFSLFAQKEGLSQPKFIANKGQFEPRVEFKLDHAAGRFYFQKDKVTYQLFDKHKIDEIRHAKSNDA